MYSEDTQNQITKPACRTPSLPIAIMGSAFSSSPKFYSQILNTPLIFRQLHAHYSYFPKLIILTCLRACTASVILYVASFAGLYIEEVRPGIEAKRNTSQFSLVHGEREPDWYHKTIHMQTRRTQKINHSIIWSLNSSIYRASLVPGPTFL